MGSNSIRQISTAIDIKPVIINRSLLAPLNLEIDPTVQTIRTMEKNQLKTLNNKFASYIEKVRGNFTVTFKIFFIINHSKLNLWHLKLPLKPKVGLCWNLFVSLLVCQVRQLEQQNKVLEIKWNLLNQQSAPSSDDVESIIKTFISNLEKQLELCRHDKVRLENECTAMVKTVEDYKTK